MISTRLDPRRHLLTGAGSGIGRALAERLRDRGDALVLVLRDARRVDDLRADFPDAELLVGDLAEPGTLNGIGRLVDGPLDTLVHAAGIVDLGAVSRLRLHEWQAQLDVNLTSPAVLTRELLPHVRQARGTVVFVNSGAGLNAHPEWSAYAASKHGLKALADCLRGEEQEHGVRVTSVYPGRTASPMQERVHEQEGKDYDAGAWIQPGTVAEAILHVLDLPADATIPDLSVRPGPR
ncbi:short chain dehydrogenase [Nocardioides gansuensis]|uniref:Short chain dehydrogenase n=1 Tax=Nocardioides gansuensis TaxID=2138300 RepID=A0A2T8FC85_9ACTN|nr:SDR family oxidoreductase [Nocardioides gansuensis]PVG83321.1 short chain dehydrogenase [Nocardioides gansuensis]